MNFFKLSGLIVCCFLSFMILGCDPRSSGAGSTGQSAIDLPRTGQATCYDTSGNLIACTGTGQDGELRAGDAWPDPRLTTGSGAETDCVTDNLTGLMWSKNANLPGAPMNWQQALAYVASMNSGTGLCGHTDWRLPNIRELESLVDASQSKPPLPAGHPFSNVQVSQTGKTPYWSSTTHAQSTFGAWIVDMSQGGAAIANKSFSTENGQSNYLWPVRSSQPAGTIQLPKTGQTSCYDQSGNIISCAGTGQDGESRTGVAWPDPRFIDNQDGTVTDKLTGLVWPKDANCMKTKYYDFDADGAAGDGMVTWQHALDFVSGINSGTYAGCGAGYTDWRLPNRKELFSLVDASQYDPTLQAGNPFVNVQWVDPGCLYWSSSFTPWFTTGEWIFGMNGGHVGFFMKTGNNFVWPVRAGKTGN